MMSFTKGNKEPRQEAGGFSHGHQAPFMTELERHVQRPSEGMTHVVGSKTLVSVPLRPLKARGLDKPCSPLKPQFPL